MEKLNQYKVNQKINLKDFEGTKISELPDEELEKKLRKVRKKLGKQGMDTSGKDSLIREVFKDFNVRGIEVHSFKVPTDLELGHDYLWRHYIALPQRGKFGVFKQINAFEKHLAENGTLIYKFFLHLSKEEQKNRLLRRLDKKEKNWKFSAGDLKERKLWDDYQRYYEDAINRTSMPHAPWYVIPADNKPAARLAVASILLETLNAYDDIKEPELDAKTKANIALYKAQLNNE